MSGTPESPTMEEGEIDHALIADEYVEIAGDDVPLAAVMKDIEVAHRELDEYKDGALVACDGIDEKIAQATINGNDQLKEHLIDVKDAAFGVYLRVQRGDLELTGERLPDAEYHGYFSEE